MHGNDEKKLFDFVYMDVPSKKTVRARKSERPNGEWETMTTNQTKQCLRVIIIYHRAVILPDEVGWNSNHFFFFISFRAKICISTIYFGVHLRYGLCCPAQMRFYFWTVWMVNGIDVDWDGKSINLLWNKHGLVVLDQRVRVKEIRSKWFDASQFRFRCETNQNTLEKIINFGGVTYICTPCSTAHRYYLAYQLILIRGSNPSPS